MGFFSVPRLSGWSFQQRIHGGVLPPPHCPDKSGPAGSPTDTLRKDSTLPPVTSKKVHHLFGDGENRQVFQRSHFINSRHFLRGFRINRSSNTKTVA
ncbi:MAG: hypothetical protein ACQEQO_09535 [Thermodesulfobacteriota bacterium]